MNKDELIRELSRLTGLQKADVGHLLASLRVVATEALRNGAPFTIPGVVTMAPVTRAARNGRNPATGEPIQIPERKAVKATSKVSLG